MKVKTTNSAMWGRRILAGCALLFEVSSAFAGQTSKISSDLQGINSSGRVNVIVQYQQAPAVLQLQQVLNLGGDLKLVLGLVKAVAYTIPVSALTQLAADPNVIYISPDRSLSSTNNGNPNAVLDYHKETINLAAAQGAGLNGAGVGVAIIDSGMIVLLSSTTSATFYSAKTSSAAPPAPTTSSVTARTWPASSPETAADPPVPITATISPASPPGHHHQSAGARSERHGHRRPGDSGHPDGDQPEEPLQHPRDQSFPGKRGIRELQA